MCVQRAEQVHGAACRHAARHDAHVPVRLDVVRGDYSHTLVRARVHHRRHCRRSPHHLHVLRQHHLSHTNLALHHNG